MIGCAFNDAYFEHVTFKDVKFKLSTYENAIFSNCKFVNCELCNINLDYVEFIDPTFEGCLFSMMQVPYAHGLLPALINNPTCFSVTDDEKIIISGSSYITHLLNALEVYYSYNFEYLPIANIYFCTKREGSGKAAIIRGIQLNLAKKDFRVVKHLCRMTQQYGYTSNERQELYNRIVTFCSIQNLTAVEYHNFTLHIEGIRMVLLERFNMPKLSLLINTNITDDKPDMLASVIERIYAAANEICGDDCDIKIRLLRNSPISINIDLVDFLHNIYRFLPFLIIIAGKFGFDVAKNYYNIKLTKKQAAKVDLERKLLEDIYNDNIFLHKTKQQLRKLGISDEQIMEAVEARFELEKRGVELTDPLYYIKDPDSIKKALQSDN
jgi:hypothetical protein